MDLQTIIQKLGILASLAEDAIEDSGKTMELVFVDSEDVKAMKGAIDILSDVKMLVDAAKGKGGEENETGRAEH